MSVLDRAQGCLLGQLAGDALGSLVEGASLKDIHRHYPDGFHDLEDGGTFDTLAGQPTDDSEMALALARMLVERSTYDPSAARESYMRWYKSRPFDCGHTVRDGLTGRPNPDSQANGAMMRVSPLGIFAAKYGLEQAARWAREDAEITHPNPVCLDANALYTNAIALAISEGPTPQEIYDQVMSWADKMNLHGRLREAIENAKHSPPPDYETQQGWVVIAFWNALWQLLHAPDLESALSDTIMRGGDTDTNAAIAGALLGAVHRREAIPQRWIETLQNCRPEQGNPRVQRPRPQEYWPVDALELAEALVG